MEPISNMNKKTYSDLELIEGLTTECDEFQKRVLWNEFYRRFINHVYKIAVNVCRNFEDAEQLAQDISQETFLRAYKFLPKFSFPEHMAEKKHSAFIKAWLGKITKNCFRTFYAKRKKEAITYDIELVMENEPVYDAFEQLYGEPPMADVNAELISKLNDALNTLSERDRHIIWIYASEGCINTTKHISDQALADLCSMYGVEAPTIRQIKKRALSKVMKFCFPSPNN